VKVAGGLVPSLAAGYEGEECSLSIGGVTQRAASGSAASCSCRALLCSPHSPDLPLDAPFPETPLMRRKRRNGAGGALPRRRQLGDRFQDRRLRPLGHPPGRTVAAETGLRKGARDYDLGRRTLTDSGRYGCTVGGISTDPSSRSWRPTGPTRQRALTAKPPVGDPSRFLGLGSLSDTLRTRSARGRCPVTARTTRCPAGLARSGGSPSPPR